MSIALILLAFVLAPVGLIMLLFRARRRRGWQLVALSLAAFAVGVAVAPTETDIANRNEARAEREAARAEEAAQEAAARTAQEQERRRAGFHCLSAWDGAHREFTRTIRAAMRDPDSFEHIETRITPVSAEGTHQLVMSYRARNGFGGMNVGTASAVIRNSDCSFTVLSIE